jgi:hypothetical protein
MAAIYPGADPRTWSGTSKPWKHCGADDVLKMETSIRDGVSFTP